MNNERINYNTEEEEIDLLALAKVLYKKRYFIGKVTGACAALGVAVTLALNPGYEGYATMSVQPPRSLNKSMLDSMEMANTDLAQQIMNTYGEVIKSRSVIHEVIRGMNKPDEKDKDINTLYEDYANRVKVEPVKNAAVMSVTITGADYEETKQFTKLLLDSFFVKVAGLDQEGSRETSSFVASQLTAAKANMEKADKELRDFQKEHKMLGADENIAKAKTRMNTAVSMRNSAELALKNAHVHLDSINEQFKQNGAIMADNEKIAAYKARIKDLTVRKTLLEDKFTEEHPDLKVLNQELSVVKAGLDSEVEAVSKQETLSTHYIYQNLLSKKVNCEVEIAINEGKLATAEQLEEEYAQNIEGLRKEQMKYSELARTAANTKDLYATLVRRLEESKIAVVNNNSAIKLMDTPVVTKAKRKGAMKVGIAFMLGLVGSAGFVLGKELLTPKFRKAEAVGDTLGLSLLANIPKAEAAQVEAYRRLRANIMALQDVKTVLFAANSEDGFRAEASKKLAELLAMAGFKTVYANTFGLAALCSGTTMRNDANGLITALADGMVANGNELLAGKAMDDLLASLRSAYDYVIIDAPALNGASDAYTVASKVDGVVYAVTEDVTSVNDARNDVLKLQQAGAKVLGGMYKEA